MLVIHAITIRFLDTKTTLVRQLKKVTYGFKQVPRAWYEKSTLSSLSLPPSISLSYHNATMYALVYVDDILLIWSSSSLLHKIIEKLHTIFSLKKLGILEIEVHYQTSGSIILTQEKQIKNLLAKVNDKKMG